MLANVTNHRGNNKRNDASGQSQAHHLPLS
jgi:hypothetical protein